MSPNNSKYIDYILKNNNKVPVFCILAIYETYKRSKFESAVLHELR